MKTILRLLRHSFCFALVTAATWLSGCASPPLMSDRDAAELGMSIDAACALPLSRLGNTRDSVFAYLGRPDREEVNDAPNRHDPSRMDRRRVLEYPGMTVLVYELPAQQRSFLDALVVYDERAALLADAGLGYSRSTLSESDAVPYATADDAVTYRCRDDVEELLTFELEDDRVVRIIWQSPID